MAERYSVITMDGGAVYVHDTLDDIPVGSAKESRFEAEIAASALNHMNRLRASLLRKVEQERERQDDQFGATPFGASSHLAILTKKVGDIASTLLTKAPRERALEQELVELLAIGLRWAEHVETTR